MQTIAVSNVIFVYEFHGLQVLATKSGEHVGEVAVGEEEGESANEEEDRTNQSDRSHQKDE